MFYFVLSSLCFVLFLLLLLLCSHVSFLFLFLSLYCLSIVFLTHTHASCSIIFSVMYFKISFNVHINEGLCFVHIVFCFSVAVEGEVFCFWEVFDCWAWVAGVGGGGGGGGGGSDPTLSSVL
mmetsp:Transcript_41720/g.105174  ORF Transcript_41720/g.105174 Transcript_41720/m.105174 type:complete len:122 (-) Transcript_41720:858-1223(-)